MTVDYKTKCCKSFVRASVDQTCRVSFEKDGRIECDEEFSEPEINLNSLYCEECGESILLSDIRQELE